MMQPAIVAVGECMIELSPHDEDHLTMNFAGDTLNTAVYCARLLQKGPIHVDYMTALGDDYYSQRMLQCLQREHIKTALIRQFPSKLPGLYLIRTDGKGERKFYYYRSQAAARDMFAGSDGSVLCQQLLNFNTIYLSGITLAILHGDSREKLLATLYQAKAAGITICFDTNYRPQLWPNLTAARSAVEAMLEYTQIALPSFEDLNQLFADNTPYQAAKRLHKLGVNEMVIKQGAKGYLVSSAGGQIYQPVQAAKTVVDTTAAGDSFNGAYIASRLRGLDPVVAANHGAQLASVVVMHKGAVIPMEDMPVLDGA